MAPTPVFMVLMNFKNLPDWIGPALIIMAIFCSVTAGFGLMSRANSPIAKGLGGLALAAVFFVFNLALVIAAGCSRMGRLGG